MSGESEDQIRLDLIETRWSLLRRAHGGSSDSSGEARNELVLRYSMAIRRYVGSIVRNDDATDEISQEAIVRFLKGDFSGADPERGRFRDLLKVAVRNMVRNYWRQQKTRATVDYEVQDVPEEAEDDPWLEAWTKSVLDLTWARLEDYERSHTGSSPYTILRIRTQFPDEDSEQMAARLSRALGKTIRADAGRQQLRRARLRFAEMLLSEVADGLDQPTPEQIEEELVALGLWEQVKGILPDDWQQKITT